MGKGARRRDSRCGSTTIFDDLSTSMPPATGAGTPPSPGRSNPGLAAEIGHGNIACLHPKSGVGRCPTPSRSGSGRRGSGFGFSDWPPRSGAGGGRFPVVPTGNFEGDEEGPSDWRGEYPDYLTAPSATLIDPAPALNALTVGSLARNELNPRRSDDAAYQPVARTDQPSPFTRHGPSVNGAIKPDLVDYGGNWIIDARTGGGLAAGPQGVGELSANSSYATQNPFREDSGTSFSAPRVAHAAARILGEIPEAGVDLCRALLVAHASTPQACRDLLADDEAIRNVAGYGYVDRSALYRSVEDCVTLWAQEAIENRRHHFYEIPVPGEFWQGGRRNREITVSMAYRPPVRTTRIDYRAAGISFKLVQAESLNAVARRFNAAVARDSVEDISERNAGRRFTEQVRSRGTVQASTWRFTQPSQSVRRSPWFVVATRNDPAWGANLVREREPYALAVILNDRLAQQSRLYSRVETQLRIQLRARQTA